MNYSEVLTTINSMFDTKLNPLFRSVNKASNKNIYDAYYLATGERLDDDTSCFTATVSDQNIVYPVVIGRSSSDREIREILFVDNKMVILCVLPEKFIQGELPKNELVRIMYSTYLFIIKSTAPVKPINQTIYTEVLNFLPLYLTVYTLNLWFKGLEFEDFEKEINIEKDLYNKLLGIDSNLVLNYSYIYGLLIDYLANN